VATADRSSARKQWVKAMQTATASTTATNSTTAASSTSSAVSSTSTATSIAPITTGNAASGRKGTLLPGASIGLAMVSTMPNLHSGAYIRLILLASVLVCSASGISHT
jgi:predicted lipid-binding transport protein (Tim44 family)